MREELLKDYGFRKHELDIYNECVSYFKHNNNGLIVLPAHCGEDKIAAAFAIENSQKTLIICASDSMFERNISALKSQADMSSIGQIHNKKYDIKNKTLIVSSVKTLVKKGISSIIDDGYLDVIIVQQAHLVVAPSNQDLLKELFSKAKENTKILGISFTSYREDGVGLQSFFPKIISTRTIDNLIESSVLVPFSLEEYSINIDVYESVVEFYKMKLGNKRGVIFCGSVEYSRLLSDTFNKRGIKSIHVDSKMKTNDFKRAVGLFDIGIVRVICNVGVMNDRVELKNTDALMFTRNIESTSLFMQIVSLAINKNTTGQKKELLIIDLSNSIKKHKINEISNRFNKGNNKNKSSSLKDKGAEKEKEKESKKDTYNFENIDVVEYFNKVVSYMDGKYILNLGIKKGFIIAYKNGEGYKIGIAGYQKIFWKKDVKTFSELAYEVLTFYTERHSDESEDLDAMLEYNATTKQKSFIDLMYKKGLFGKYNKPFVSNMLEGANCLSYGFFRAREKEIDIKLDDIGLKTKNKYVAFINDDGSCNGAISFENIIELNLESKVYCKSKYYYKLIMEITESVKLNEKIELKHINESCSINSFKFKCSQYSDDSFIKDAVDYCMKWNEYLEGFE